MKVAGMEMAQPSVAREPSMEEILASIRRIIESNEPQAENPPQSSLPPFYAEDEIEEDDIDLVTEMAANDRGLPVQEPAYQPLAETQPERSLSLADVAARVRAASDRPVDPRPMVSVAAPVAEPVSAPASKPAISEAASEVLYLQPERPAAEPIVQQVENAPASSATVAAPAEPVRVEAALGTERPQPQGLPARIEAEASLLSAEAGEQVARSFGELAAAFDGIQNRSLEDLAQDMLRPMLQEWLDDNLPTLVERLVREEIERVARGPRR